MSRHDFSKISHKSIKESIWNLSLVPGRCPKEMSSHITVVIKLCLKYVTYDPNYNYEAEDDQEDSMDIEDRGDEAQGEITFYTFEYS